MIPKKIEGKSIYLIPITINDTALIIKWRNNPRVMKNFRFDGLFTTELHETWMREQVASGKVIQYIIHIRSTDKPIGSVYFRDIDSEKKTAEFGIFIGEDSACSHGYGNETTQLFTNYGTSEFGLQEIQLRVYEDNAHAISCYKKAGYTLVDDDGEDIITSNGDLRHMLHMVLRTR